MLAFVLWIVILALALPQSNAATVTQSASTPTQLKKTPGFWHGFLNLPSLRPKPSTIDLPHLSSILISGLTPVPMPTRTSSGRVVWITTTPGGGVTTVTSVITSVVMASLPPTTVITWVQPSNAAKREEQLPGEVNEDSSFTLAITNLPEAVLKREDNTEDKKDDTSLSPNTKEATTLLRHRDNLSTPRLTRRTTKM
ncbi:unnamed protein product [Alternaria alternata]